MSGELVIWQLEFAQQIHILHWLLVFPSLPYIVILFVHIVIFTLSERGIPPLFHLALIIQIQGLKIEAITDTTRKVDFCSCYISSVSITSISLATGDMMNSASNFIQLTKS